MAARAEPDKLLMVLYLSKFFEAFRKSSLNNICKESDENGEENPSKTNHRLLNLPQPRKRTPRDEKKLEDDSVNKRRRKGNNYLSELSCQSAPPAGEDGELRENKVRSMATQLQAKFENSSTAKCVGRRDVAAGLGGSDVCHFCTKRVYVMERLSAEGFFFHRECFRCDVCNCTLRLGGHSFDSQEVKFYCKMHYAQRRSSCHLGRVRRRTEDQSSIKPSSLDGGIYPSTGGAQPTGGASSLQAERLCKGQRIIPGDAEMAVDALEASCIIGPAKEEGQIPDSTKGLSSTKHGNRWKRKIRTTFPLIFNKHKQETVPDSAQAASTGKQADSKSTAEVKNHSEGSERKDERSAAIKSASSAPRKRLVLTQSDKEKLLNWELKPEETSTNSPQHEKQVQTEADELQTNPSQDGTTSQSQTSAFQVLANAFRRTFSGSAQPSSSKTAVVMRPKRDGLSKRRPVSEGAFGFNSKLSNVVQNSSKEERRTSVHDVRWASVSTDPWGAGRDLPSLLQQVSLNGQRDPEGVFSHTANPRSKRLDLFSSLRLRKRDVPKGEGSDQEVQKEIRTFLSNLRNKASSQQHLEEPSSSSDENETPTSSLKISSEKQKKKQEKMAVQQAKREQLKRLHRAQMIQRQLEEVEEKQRDLEEKGVAIEKTIRAEDTPAMDDRDEAQLYQAWFQLVLEKNRLARYESELMIFAQELALEDTQSRLQQDLRCRMVIEDTQKSASELQEEQEILVEIMRTVEKRDMLVSILEEQRLKERAEDKDLESLILSRGYEFHWAHGSDS
uniref:Microtubule associated monoxygenase, calponin and LIM domain containing 2b n=2 Tax=Nothobranchius pienaari TaxID=704102 RepID=A0A1A8L580_9TELE